MHLTVTIMQQCHATHCRHQEQLETVIFELESEKLESELQGADFFELTTRALTDVRHWKVGVQL
jgi:hypothetical protein